MLSDHERRELRAVESWITAEDPHFARTLKHRQEHLSDRRRQLADRAVFIVAGVLGIGALWAGSPASAAALVAAVLLTWSLWRSTGSGDDTFHGSQRGARR